MRGRATLIAVLVVGTAAAAGCSSSTASSPVTAKPSAATPTSSSTPTAGTGFFGKAQTVACNLDLDQVQTAVDAYMSLNGTGSITEDALVSAGLLRAPSTLHDIKADGSVVPAPGADCVS